MRRDLKIGELAEQVGLHPTAIRYYEDIGLLPQAERTDAGYRRYGANDRERLAFIQRAKLLGLSLDEIRDILSLRAADEEPCQHVLGLVDAKIATIDRRIADLRAFRTELAALQATWIMGRGIEREHAPHSAARCRICPIIEQQAEVHAHPEADRIVEPAARRRRRRSVRT